MQRSILFLLLAIMLCGCGRTESAEQNHREDWDSALSVNVEERYTAYLEGFLQEMLLDMSEEVEQASIAIMHLEDSICKVEVELTFSEDARKAEEIKALAEEVLTIYFPEGSAVYVTQK